MRILLVISLVLIGFFVIRVRKVRIAEGKTNLPRLIHELHLEKRRTDIIAASISDGIILLRGKEIVYTNPIADKILASSSGEPSEGKDKPARKRDGRAAVFDALSKMMPSEFCLEIADQRKLHYMLQAYPISERLVEQVEHSLGGLGTRWLDRWQADRLIIARDVTLVRESQEAKGHFIATLSHEVKTPVTSLTMATRLLKKSIAQIPNANHRALIETCVEDVDRLRDLIDDLLSVSRFDTLTQELEKNRVDLRKMLKQSVQFFQAEAFDRGVEIVAPTLMRGKPVLIHGDATKISWAMSNLMTNALRHTPRGGRIDLSLSEHVDSVEVRIRDTGPGIEKNRQDQIFEKFNSYYDLRVARSGSVGMGLAIAREIVVAHAGKISVNSEPGQGAEFCVTLPLKRKDLGCIGTTTKMIEKGDVRGTCARG